MPYIELWGPPGSGKTTKARAMLCKNANLHPGRRSLRMPGKKSIHGIFVPGISRSRLLLGVPSDLFIAIRIILDLHDIRKLPRTTQLLSQARALHLSSEWWVLDQGLMQYIFSLFVKNLITLPIARKWKRRLYYGPYSAAQVIPVQTTLPKLERQIMGSPKHVNQAGESEIIIYSKLMIEAFNRLCE